MNCPYCGTAISGNPDQCPICLKEFEIQPHLYKIYQNIFLFIAFVSSTIISIVFFFRMFYGAAYLFIFPYVIILVSCIFAFAFSLSYLEKFYRSAGKSRYSAEAGASLIGEVSLFIFVCLFAFHNLLTQYGSVNQLFILLDSFIATISAFIFAIFQLSSLIYVYGFLKLGRRSGNTGLMIGGSFFLIGGILSGSTLWESGIIFTPLIGNSVLNYISIIPHLRYVIFGGFILLALGILFMLVLSSREAKRSF